MGVIHMNGRIYDPLIGRFMSADPFIQFPGNLQSYNRYAYVVNNPLAYTDPSGYFSLRKFFRAVVAIAVAIYAPQFINQIMIASAGGVPTAFVGMSGGGIFSSAATAVTGLGSAVSGALTGFAVGAIGSGNLQGGLQGALSGGMFGGIGASFEAGTAASYAGHAAAGCIGSAAGGGNCGNGAASALFGKFTSNNINLGDTIANGVATSVAGGVGSVIAGGKFENGATTAAFGYLFNHLSVLTRGAQLVQQAWGRLQMLVGSSSGQVLTEMAAAEIGMASVGPGKAAAALERALGSATVDPKHAGQFVTSLEDGSRLMFRKEYGHVEGFGPAVHYNIHLQHGSKQVLNIHAVTGADGRIVYAKDSVGRWNGGQAYRAAPEEQIPK